MAKKKNNYEEIISRLEQQMEALGKKAERINTEYGECERQLHHLERLSTLGEYLSGIVHELNNPLNVVIQNCLILSEDFNELKRFLYLLTNEFIKKEADKKRIIDYLSDHNLDSIIEEDTQILKNIKEGSDRAQQIILSIKNFYRKEKDESVFFEINDLLSESIALLKNFEKNKVRFIRNFGMDLPRFYGNRSKINQVFTNLLVNALQAVNKSSGIIEVSTSINPVRKEIIIEITDNGCGISEEIRDKIFQPFFTTKEKGTGTGLGLPISKKIIEEYKGTLCFETKPGKYTKFIVNLPV